MPFSNAWSNTIPVDGQLADLIGADIRQTRLDVFERMNQALVKDWTADPLVLQDSIVGLTNGLQRIIPFSAFLNDLHSKEDDITDGRLNGFVGNDLFAPLGSYVPNGCVVTLMEWLVDITPGAASVDCSLKRRQFSNGTPAPTSINTTNVNVAGGNIAASPALAHTVDAGYMYYLMLHGNGGAGSSFYVYGARITFNRPALANAT